MLTLSVPALARRLAMLAVALPAFAQIGNLQLSTNAISFTAALGNTLPQTQTVGVTSTGASLPVTVSVRYFTATEGWLSALATSSNTPSNVNITVNPSGLPTGNYTGQVLVVASASQSALVTVSLTVTSAGTGSSLLSASPTSVFLNSSDGYTAQTVVNISSFSSIPFQLFTNTTNGGNWLSVNTITATAPTSFSVIANPSGLVPGVYTGTVNVAPSNGSAGVSIPVTFTVTFGGTSGFTVSPGNLSFIFQTGTATPASQSVYVSNSTAIVSYTATANASWVKLTSNNNGVPSQVVNGTSNSNLNVYVDPTGLTQGTYSTNITITSSTASTQTVAVTLIVSGTAILTANPSSLVFTYLPDTGVPVGQFVTIGSTGTAVSFTATASSSGWLVVGPQNGNTASGENVLTVSITPGGLPGGTYSGSIIVTTGANTVTIPVTLNVGTSSNSGIQANPPNFALQSTLFSAPSTYTLVLSSLSSKSFLASANSSGGSWLQVAPNNGFSPASLTITINPQFVSGIGVYSGFILISNLTDGTQLTVPVTMTLSGPTLSASPQVLSFSLAAGSSTSISQTIQLSGSSNLTFNAISDSPWLTVSPAAGGVPALLNVTANSSTLSVGNYAGVITITGGGATTNVTVNASVGASTNSLVLNPTNLSFSSTTGAAAPVAQTIGVASSGGSPQNFTASVRTANGVNWLRASSSSISTPATLTVNVDPAGLAPGVYRGVVSVTATSSGESRSAEVLLTIRTPASPTLYTAQHGATRQLSAVAPGMVLSLKGSGLGPFVGTPGAVSPAGAVETSYNGFRVFFDGVAAPILYISDTQIDTVAPYAIAGHRSTRVEVDNNGARSAALELVVSPDAAPGLFTVDSSGRGQAAAINLNGTLNGPANPVSAIDGVISFYATGEGQTVPPGQDGRIIITDLRKPVLPVAVNIGGEPVEVLYAGSAPGIVSGVMQVNVRLNPSVPRGPAVQVELRVGPAPSPTGVTIAVQ